MKQNFPFMILLLFLLSCNNKSDLNKNVITSDVNNFWNAYDKITSTQDSILQLHYLDSLYLKKGTIGLEGIMRARNYTPEEYIYSINNYPKFWKSVRSNTLKAENYIKEIQLGLAEVKKLYPKVKPNKIYFTIGALRTGGTYLDSLALIGSEMAMVDENTDASEFPESIRQGRQTYFKQNPLEDIVFLAVQEYVHTQQNPFVYNLLSICLHEGIGDFITYTALNIEPDEPAILYGKQNASVREKFEQEMFYINNQNKWLWSDAPNEFGVRDLGYYIGYQICENYYNQAENKKQAIKTMIELDYENENQIEDFVRKSNFFSVSLDELYQNFESNRPYILRIEQFKNNSQNVNPSTNLITVEFSEPLTGTNTGVDFGELGQDAFPKNTIAGRHWSNENTKWSIPVTLEPNKRYQILLSNNFRNNQSIPLKPYLIDFKTRSK